MSDQNGHLIYAASEKQTYRTSMERQVEEEELKKETIQLKLMARLMS